MTLRLLVFATGSILGLWAFAVAVARRRLAETRQAETQRAKSAAAGWRLAVALTFVVVFAMQLVFRSKVDWLQGGDEYCRANYALDWALHPFFAPPDHVWLAGHFHALGTAFRLLGNMPLAVLATSLLGTAMTVFLAMAVARRIWGTSTAAVFAGVLVGSEWFLLWASANPYAEVFSYPALLAGFWAWLKAWQVPRDQAETGWKSPDPYFLLAAAFIGFGEMFRYEMWYAGILFGGFLGGRFLWMLIQPEKRRWAWAPMGGCVLLAAYPAAWLISNRIALGSPFAFLHKTSQ